MFKKIKTSKFFGSSRFLLALIISPAFEKTLSEGTEVAGIIEYFTAILNNESRSDWCLIQKSSGILDRFSKGRLIYWFISVCAVVFDVKVVLSSSTSVAKNAHKSEHWFTMGAECSLFSP